MEGEYKVCARCGAEFQQWVTHCSDCGLELQWAPRHPPERSEPLPPTSELICIRVSDAWEARALAEELQSAGIPCRIDTHAPDSSSDCGGADPLRLGQACARKLGVYVRAEDAPSAAAIETALAARRTPELAELGETRALDANACPACGAALDARAPSCESCGLSFPGE